MSTIVAPVTESTASAEAPVGQPPPAPEAAPASPAQAVSQSRRRYKRKYFPRPQITTGNAAKFNTDRLEQSYELRRSSYTTLDGRRYDDTVRLWDKIFFCSSNEIDGDDLTAFLEDWGAALPREVINGLLKGVPLYVVSYKPLPDEIDWFDQSFPLPVTTLVCGLSRPNFISRPPQRFRHDGRPLKRDRRFVYVDGEPNGKGGYHYGFSIFGSLNLDDPAEEHADDCILFFEWEPGTGCAADALYKLDFARGRDSLCALDHLRSYLNAILFGNTENVPEDEEDEEDSGEESSSRVAAVPEGGIPQRSVRRERYPAPPEKSGMGNHGPRRSAPPARRGYTRRNLVVEASLDMTAAAKAAEMQRSAAEPPKVDEVKAPPLPPVVEPKVSEKPPKRERRSRVAETQRLVEASKTDEVKQPPPPPPPPPPMPDPKSVRWCIRKNCSNFHRLQFGVGAKPCEGVFNGKPCEKPLTIPKSNQMLGLVEQLQKNLGSSST